jgi:hypothetical protein
MPTKRRSKVGFVCLKNIHGEGSALGWGDW